MRLLLLWTDPPGSRSSGSGDPTLRARVSSVQSWARAQHCRDNVTHVSGQKNTVDHDIMSIFVVDTAVFIFFVSSFVSEAPLNCRVVVVEKFKKIVSCAVL